MPLRLALVLLSAVSLAHGATEGRAASASARQSAIRIPQSANAGVAVLDLGATETGRRATERLAKRLAGAGANGETKLSLLDRDLVRAAARGVGYRGSLNMTLAEARSVGAAIGCDFYVTGDAQTLRRSSSARPVYFEAYASVFVVSAHRAARPLGPRRSRGRQARTGGKLPPRRAGRARRALRRRDSRSVRARGARALRPARGRRRGPD